MKKIVAFKIGDEIPDSATFLFVDRYSNNNLQNIYYEVKIKEESQKKDDPKHYCINEVIAYLNNVAGKNYNQQTKKTRDLIRVWLNQGFNLDQFKAVIDIKSNAWLTNPEFNKFLRPQTLFGPKFESYLNEVDSEAIADKPFDDLDSFLNDEDDE